MALAGGNGMKLIKTYVVPESWENDSKGNTLTIFNTIMDGETISMHDIYIFVVENNSTTNTNYKGSAMVVVSKVVGNSTDIAGAAVRNNWYNVRSISSNISFWISQGATIKVYKEEFPA